MYLALMDEKRIKNFKPNGNNPILIRIFNPNSDIESFDDIKYIDCYKSVLGLYMKDITSMDNIDLEESFKLLNKFILDNNFDEIVIHCSMGISRSPAIMICIARILNNSMLEEEIKSRYKCYNRYIVDQFDNFKYISRDDVCSEFVFEDVCNYLKRRVRSKDNFIIIN